MNRILFLISLVFFVNSQILIDLKDQTFTQITEIPFVFSKNFTLSSNWFIMFYAPWCGHCKTALPQWIKLASSKLDDTKIGLVNCVANPNICDAVSVQGYPTLVLFTKNGTAYDYRSQRQHQKFVQFLNGGYINHPVRQLKKINISQIIYQFVNSMDAFSLLIAASLFATFWFLIFRFLFSEPQKEIVISKKLD